MPRKDLQLAGALGHAAADKRVEILRRVGALGSISQAARDAGVSYKAAWQALDTLSNLAGATLVERVVGGAGGGGARLTSAGERVLQAADEVARARHAVLDRLAERTLPASVAGLALRTSMRNQLPCRVAALRNTGGAVDVTLELAEGGRLLSRITRESVQLLQLARGLEVLALCKATAVDVRAQPDAGRANVLEGTISRATRAGAAGEVALSLAGGLQVVGFTGAGSGLVRGSPACAHLDAAAVVIALAG